MKKIILLFAVIIVLIIVFNIDNGFDIRIEIISNNVSALNMDRIFADDIKDNILQIAEVKEIVIFSKADKCNIYCKIYPFFNKKRVISQIERKLKFALYDKLQDIQILIDDSYNTRYDTFLVVSSAKVSDKVLKNYYEDIIDRLSEKKFSSKYLRLIDKKRATYIYFTDEILKKYNLELSDIKNIIQNNNIIKNSTIKSNEANSYYLNVNSNFENADDIKNLTLHFKDKNFLIKFSDVFDVVDDVKTPPLDIALFNLEKSLVLAISKNPKMPKILFNYELNKFIKNLNKIYPSYIKVDFINPFFKTYLIVVLNHSSSLDNTLDNAYKIQKELIKNNIKNSLLLVGTDGAKIERKSDFFEKDKYKITILLNRFDIFKTKRILKNNSIFYLDNNYKDIEDFELEKLNSKIQNSDFKFIQNTYKTLSINYDLDEFDLNDYGILKNDVLDYLFAYNDGLILGKYFDKNNNCTDIILKNIENKNIENIYTKNYKNFIFLSAFSKNSLVNSYTSIARKNGKFWARLYK